MTKKSALIFLLGLGAASGTAAEQSKVELEIGHFVGKKRCQATYFREGPGSPTNITVFWRDGTIVTLERYWDRDEVNGKACYSYETAAGGSLACPEDDSRVETDFDGRELTYFRYMPKSPERGKAVCENMRPHPRSRGNVRPEPENLRLAARYLSGRFSSAEQARGDAAYYDVTLQTCEIAIKPAPGAPHPLEGQKYLYVEQALRGQDPYRQRVYRLSQEGGLVVSSIHKLIPHAEITLRGYCGAASHPPILATALVDSDCAVTLSRFGDALAGGTPPEGCPNNFRGAKTVSSEVRLSRKGIDAWDRAWDGNGRQVWGPKHGPYEFRPER
jgi:hypothetical protein